MSYDMGAVVQGEGVISNLDYHRDGKYLLMTTSEGSMQIIDAFNGEEKKKLYAKEFGIGKAKYTHHESCVLVTAEKRSYDVKYWCLYDNRYLRNFVGHSDMITSLSMSPIDDTFLTASNDKSIILWNLSVPKPIAKLTLPQSTQSAYAAFDESGMVFGVLCYDSLDRTNCIKLFDARNSEAGPFLCINPENIMYEAAAIKANQMLLPSQAQKMIRSPWSSLEFSADGNHMLVNTRTELLLVLDSFRSEAEPIVIASRKNDSSVALGACISSNAKFVLTANEDNEVLLCDKMSGELQQMWSGHVAPVGCIRSNPKFDQYATGCVNTVLWIPKDQ